MTPTNIPQYLLQHVETGRFLIRTPGLVDWTMSPAHATRFDLKTARLLRGLLAQTGRIFTQLVDESHLPNLENC